MGEGARPRRTRSVRRAARPRVALAPMCPLPAEDLGALDDSYLLSPLPDGWRCLAVLDDRVRIRSRRGLDLAPLLPRVAEALVNMRERSGSEQMAVLDGVLCWPASHVSPTLADVESFAVLDVLLAAGRDVTGAGLQDRIAALRALSLTSTRGPITLTPSWRGSAAAAYRQVVSDGAERSALLARRASARYRPGGRTRDWLVFAERRLFDVVLCGIAATGALVLGAPTIHGLAYAGVTWPTRRWEELAPRCVSADPPYPLPPLRGSLGAVAWLEPTLWIAVEPDVRPSSRGSGPRWRFVRVQEDLCARPS